LGFQPDEIRAIKARLAEPYENPTLPVFDAVISRIRDGFFRNSNYPFLTPCFWWRLGRISKEKQQYSGGVENR
jgi:hypothetical protein